MLQGLPLAPRVRAPRFDVEQELVVSSKTIGTALTYNLATENVSKSGMLLAWEHSTPVPFAENTILEMTIDPGATVLEKPVACLGKVVRRVNEEADGKRRVQFGVRIVQIDHTDLDNWELCIEDLAIKASSKVGTDTPLLGEEEEDKAHDPKRKKKYRHAA